VIFQNLIFFGNFFYFITGFGHEAVMIFFVLSGFFISRSVINAIENKSWSFKIFLFNRLSRLWFVLIPALLIGGFIDAVGLSFLENTIVYQDKISFLKTITSFSQLSISSFFGNLFFTQNILTSTYGSNSPLWSLSNEFWYYILFPFITIAFISFKKKKILKFIIYSTLTLLVFLFIGIDMSIYFMIWMMGFLAFKLQNRFMISKYFKYLVLFLFLTSLIMIRLSIYPIFFNDLSLGLITAILVLTISNVYISNNIMINFIKHISNISYTLYVFHFPFILLTVAYFKSDLTPFNSTSFINYISVLTITYIYIYCYIMWYLFERNTNKIKNIIKKI
jgi:peptidoglycan/LPS O-acetylase OafA/YrhL